MSNQTQAIIADTPRKIARLRLIALRAAIKFEDKGMRRSRGRSATAIAKDEFGLPRNTSRSELIDILTAEIDGKAV